jgi:paraquat-inducible protein A
VPECRVDGGQSLAARLRVTIIAPMWYGYLFVNAPRARQVGVIGCHECGLVFSWTDQLGPVACTRCRSPLRHRWPHSLAASWLLFALAMLLYLPANLLPVMKIRLAMQGEHSLTIIDGVRDLWNDGTYDVAIIVFVASVALPCAKFMALGALLLSVQWQTHWARRQRTYLHDLLELIGYWSMLDVLVVSVLGSLVQFQALGEIEPDAGIFFFGASVMLTMLAVRCFDSRLIWDAV